MIAIPAKFDKIEKLISKFQKEVKVIRCEQK